MNHYLSQLEIRSQWVSFMSNPLLSMSYLKAQALRGEISDLRSVHWRIFLGQLPAPIGPRPEINSQDLVSWSIALETSRLEWDCVRQRFLRAPDGKWIEDSAGDNLSPSALPSLLNTTRVTDVRVNNPLSQDKANPWNLWFDDLEMRQTIYQDVIRTFPDSTYFRQIEVQNMLTNILHVYSKMHADVGYRQGMHEVLAVIIKTLDTDALDTDSSPAVPDLIHQVLSRKYLEHDSYILFSRLMRKVKDWYDFNSTIPLRDSSSSSLAPDSIGFLPPQLTPNPPSTPNASFNLVPPIVDKCSEIFNVHLRSIDPELWSHLEELQIEPQIWGIRWLRLLFTREFSYDASLILWDAILAEDSCSLRLADFLCLSMLLRIRDCLLDSDYSSALQTILKYPMPADGEPRTELLIYQALLLSHCPNAETAAQIHQQNVDTGAIAGGLPGTRELESTSKAWAHTSTSHPTHHSQNRVVMGPNSPSNLRGFYQQPKTSHMSDEPGVTDLAKGVHDKAESYGINKTLFGAFSDFRKSYSASQRPVSSGASTSLRPNSASMVLTKSHTDFTAEQKAHYLHELKSGHMANRAIGSAIAVCVSSLEHVMQTAKEDSLDPSQALTLGALRHIRDVMLTGVSSGFDVNVMNPLIEFQANISLQQSPSSAVSARSRSHEPTMLPGATGAKQGTQNKSSPQLITPNSTEPSSCCSSPRNRRSTISHGRLPTNVSSPISPKRASVSPQSDRQNSSGLLPSLLPVPGAPSLFSRSSPVLQTKRDDLTPLGEKPSSIGEIPLHRIKPSPVLFPSLSPPLTGVSGHLWNDDQAQPSSGKVNHRDHSPSSTRMSFHGSNMGHTSYLQSHKIRLSKSDNPSGEPDPLGVLGLSNRS